jgi:8-oxo-dGTP pyrophosphatase MutT (NUDIX family)
MVASGFLPIAIHKNQLYFLFGKEANDDDAPGWSDFVGGVDEGENIEEAGIREFAEETSGFFGDEADVRRIVSAKGKLYEIVDGTYHTRLLPMKYDDKLVEYYNNSHKFLYSRLDNAYLKSTKIFEKVEMRWFSVAELKSRRGEFRKFYVDVVDKILADLPKIREYIRSKKSVSGEGRGIKSRKTRRASRKTAKRSQPRTQS